MANFGFNPEREKIKKKHQKGLVHKKEPIELQTAPIEFRNGCSSCIGQFVIKFNCPACGKPVDVMEKEND